MPKPFHPKKSGKNPVIHSWVYLAVMPLLVAFLFGHILISGGAQILSSPRFDLALHFIPWREYVFSSWRQGHIPFWDPYAYSGVPCFADMEAATFYPLGFLFFFLSPGNAANWTIAIHVLLTGTFTFFWLKHRDLHPLACLFGACIFMLGGTYFLHIGAGHLSNLCTICWTPLILLAIDGWKKNASMKWFSLGVLSVTLQLLAGHVQYFYYTALISGVYALWECFEIKKKLHFFLGFASFYAFALCLGAIQLLPAVSVNPETLRGHGLSFEQASTFPFPWECLPTIVFPDLFGNLGSYEGPGFYSENSLFMGTIGFWLLAFGIPCWKEKRWRPFVGLAAFSLILALGSQTPLYRLFYRLVPLFGDFRGVSKFNFLVALFLSALAAIGIDRLLRDERPAHDNFALSMASFGFISILVSVFLLTGKTGPSPFGPLVAAVRDLSAFGWISLSGGMILMAIPRIKKFPRIYFTMGMAGLGILELLLFAGKNIPTFKAEDYLSRIGALESFSAAHPGDYRVATDFADENTSIRPDLWGVNPMVLDRYARLIAASQGIDPQSLNGAWNAIRDRSPLLGLLRFRYRILEDTQGLRIFPTGLQELPRVLLLGRFEIDDQNGALKRMQEPGFDPEKTVLLEKEPVPAPVGSKNPGSVSVKDLDPDRLEITADLKSPSVLLLGENYAEDWVIHPIEKEIQPHYEILPADLTLRAVPLCVGHHHFLMEYKPRFFEVGKWISLISLAAYAAANLLLVLVKKKVGSGNPDIQF